MVEDPSMDHHPLAGRPLPEFVDWILGALIALGGLTGVVAGSAVAFLVDRESLEEGIEEGTITVTIATTELTETEMLVVSEALAAWTGVGLLAVGSGMVIFALGYVLLRHLRHRRDRAGEPVNSYGAFAVLGAVATAVLSFIPFSPVLGGALAGYLERGESRRTVSVGALAGVLAASPILVLLVFVLGGGIAGMLAIDQGGLAVVLGTTLALSLLFLATFTAGLGAVGGYLGGKFAESRSTSG